MRIKNKFIYLLFTFFCITSPVYGQTVIQMEKDGGVYKIPCEINGLRLKLIFDTGASSICISESIAVMMLENGYLDSGDIVGSGSSVVADGRIVDNTIINIKTLKIGDVTLSDVQAVVIHQQSAPLLLGQSAIQKLGNVSLDGDKLILVNHKNDLKNDTIKYTDVEVLDILESAKYARMNEFYELAVDNYEKLYKTQQLDLEGTLHYASCLRMTDCYEKALLVHKTIEQDVIKAPKENQRWAYFGMMICYHELCDYRLAILYGQKTLSLSDYEYNSYTTIIYWLSMSYIALGENYKAKKVIDDEIEKYLLHIGYKSIDCWNRNADDEILGNLYWILALYYNDIKDNAACKKYAIMAAAWGNTEAIQWADKRNISYSKKPKDFKY